MRSENHGISKPKTGARRSMEAPISDYMTQEPSYSITNGASHGSLHTKTTRFPNSKLLR